MFSLLGQAGWQNVTSLHMYFNLIQSLKQYVIFVQKLITHSTGCPLLSQGLDSMPKKTFSELFILLSVFQKIGRRYMYWKIGNFVNILLINQERR